MAHKLGLDMILHRWTGAAGAEVDPIDANWTVIGNIKDVTLTLEKGQTDVTTRASQGWRLTAATLKDASIEFQMQYDPSDASYTAFEDAFFNNTSIGIVASDGDISQSTNNKWIRFQADVFNFARREPLEESVVVDVTLKPTSGTVTKGIADV